MSEDRILLTDMVFHSHHGTLPAENELGQPFVVSVELHLDLRPAGTSDDLTKTVDYDEENTAWRATSSRDRPCTLPRPWQRG
jgi:dihydroneopterin aldolase